MIRSETHEVTRYIHHVIISLRLTPYSECPWFREFMSAPLLRRRVIRSVTREVTRYIHHVISRLPHSENSVQNSIRKESKENNEGKEIIRWTECLTGISWLMRLGCVN